MERFFRIIGRVNSVLFLLLLIGIGGFILYNAFYTETFRRGGAVTAIQTGEGQAPREVALRFGYPETILGSETVMLSLEATMESNGLIGSKSDDGETRNTLFMKGDGTASWLFEANANRVFEITQVAEDADPTSYGGAYQRDVRERGPTRLLLVGYTLPGDAATNGQGEEGPMRVAFAQPDGSGLTERLQGVDEIIAVWLSPAKTLTVLYRSEAVVHRAQYALEGFREISNAAVAEIPKTL